MQVRGLLAAVLVLAGLAGAIWWSNQRKKAEEGKPSPDAPPEILKIPAGQIREIQIRRSGKEPMALRKTDTGAWIMASPPQWPVDQDMANGMAATLYSLISDRLVEEKPDDYGQFGLAAPAVEVLIVRQDGVSHKLLIGDETPAGGARFVRVEGDPRVFTLAGYNVSTLDKTAREVRDKRLLTFDRDKLTRLELAARGQTLEFGKNSSNEWQIIRPRPLRADGGRVEELISRLADARMDLPAGESEDAKIAAAFSSARPVAVARVTDAGGTQQIEVRRGAQGECYARSSAVAGVFKVFGDLSADLDKSLDDFRNKKLFDFGWSEPDRIEIRDGERRASYAKSGDQWMSGSKRMDADSVHALIDQLRELTAVRFGEQGFTNAVLEITVSSNQGKRIEKVLVSQNGNTFWARRENEPSLYELEASAIDALRKAVSAVKEHQQTPSQQKKR